jgi:hypothetical protein
MAMSRLGPEEVISFRIAEALLPILNSQGYPASPLELEQVKCVRFGGSRLSSATAVFRAAVYERMRDALHTGPAHGHYEAALRAVFPIKEDIGTRALALQKAVHDASMQLGVPFPSGVSREMLLDREVTHVTIRVDAFGTHFHTFVHLRNGEQVTLIFSAAMLALFDKEMG